MDLNELLFAHQRAVMRAGASADENLFGKIAEYAEQIRLLRPIVPSSPIARNPAGPPTIIYGSYAGDTAEPKSATPCTEPPKPSARDREEIFGRVIAGT